MSSLSSSQNYVSSIIHKYGDHDNVINDAIALNDILLRQGTLFLTDRIAEYVGKSTNKYGLTNEESTSLLESIVTDLREATYERI